MLHSNDLVCKRTEMYLTGRLDRRTLSSVTVDHFLFFVQLSDFGLKTLHRCIQSTEKRTSDIKIIKFSIDSKVVFIFWMLNFFMN